MLSSIFARSSVFAALFVGIAVLPTKAQPMPPVPAPSSTENTIGPGIHDNGGLYSEEDRKKIAEAIADLYKRQRVYVLIETCESVPDGAGAVDPSDSAAIYHALGVWRDHLVAEADKRNTVVSWVMVQTKNGHRYSFWMGYGIFSRAEGDEINHEMVHQLRTGMTNALGYLGRAVARKQGRIAKETAPNISAEEKKRRIEQALAAQQILKGGVQRLPGEQAKAYEEKRRFQETAQDGGLSGPDLDVVEVARNGVSYEVLTDFAKDQIKEGRRGKDLKDDLVAFIKLFNREKK